MIRKFTFAAFGTLTTLGVVSASAAAAQCANQIMACTYNQGANAVEICLGDEDVIYTQGPTDGSNDLVIETPIATIDYTPWPGTGGSIFETITVFNGDTGYALTAGFERDPNPETGYGGISVTNNGSEINYLTCDADSIDWSYGNQLAKAKRDLGQCWGGSPDVGWVACE